MTETKASRLRAALQERRPITVAPGAFDPLSARIYEDAGFSVLSATGAGISVSHGYPDVGLLTQTEVTARIKAMADVTQSPILADADTGYGNIVNVSRTVREFEAAGAAGIHIEDQVTPKKCGQLAGKELITPEEMVQKIEVALSSRRDPDFVIVARTDARSVSGLEEAIGRANIYAEAGADGILIYGAHSLQEIREIGSRVTRAPLVGHISKGGLENLSADDLENAGYSMVIFPLQAILLAAATMHRFATALRPESTGTVMADSMWSPRQLYDLVGLPDVEKLEAQFDASRPRLSGGVDK